MREAETIAPTAIQRAHSRLKVGIHTHKFLGYVPRKQFVEHTRKATPDERNKRSDGGRVPNGKIVQALIKLKGQYRELIPDFSRLACFPLVSVSSQQDRLNSRKEPNTN